MGVMPIFPLGTVLLPGALLPLQVFEPRYRQMVQDILADDAHEPEFGVALIERGQEVGGGDQRAPLGTVAKVIDIRVLPGNRYGLVAVGVERFRVSAWLPDDPYPLADVDLWPDEIDATGGPDRDRIEAVHNRIRTLNRDVETLGELIPPPDAEISGDPLLAVYHLGSLAPLGAADRYRMLASPTLAERLDVLENALDDVAAMLEFRRS
jgi:uncharacterized protein